MRATSIVSRAATASIFFASACALGQRPGLAEPAPTFINCTFPTSAAPAGGTQSLPANGMKSILALKGGRFPANRYAPDKDPNEPIEPMNSLYADITIRDVKVYRAFGETCTAPADHPGTMVVRLRISATTTVPVQGIRVLCGLYAKDPNVMQNVKLSSLNFPFTFAPIENGEEGLSLVFLNSGIFTATEATITVKGPTPSFVDVGAVLQATGTNVTFKVIEPLDTTKKNTQWDKGRKRYQFKDDTAPWLVRLKAVTAGVDGNLPNDFPLDFQKTSAAVTPGLLPSDFKRTKAATESSADAFGTFTPGGEASTSHFVDDIHLGRCEARVNE